jgi:hypothetical protein
VCTTHFEELQLAVLWLSQLVDQPLQQLPHCRCLAPRDERLLAQDLGQHHL